MPAFLAKRAQPAHSDDYGGRAPFRRASINQAIPGDLETIVLKAMAKEPAQRYATAQELADDLRAVPGGRADPGPAAVAGGRGRRSGRGGTGRQSSRPSRFWCCLSWGLR